MLSVRITLLLTLGTLFWSCNSIGENSDVGPRASTVTAEEHPGTMISDSAGTELVDCSTFLERHQAAIDRMRPVPEGYLPEDFVSVHDSTECNGTVFRLGHGLSYDTIRLAWCHDGVPGGILLEDIEVYARWWKGDVPKDQIGLLKIFDASTAYSYEDLYIVDCGGAEPTVALVIRAQEWNLGPGGLQTADVSKVSLRYLTVRDTTSRIWSSSDHIESDVFPRRTLLFDTRRRIYYERLIFLDTVLIAEEIGHGNSKVIRDSLPMVTYSFAEDKAMVYWQERWWWLTENRSQLRAVYRVVSESDLVLPSTRLR